MTRSYYDFEPHEFEAVGNGSYLYRWDIQKEAAVMAESDGEEMPSRTHYSCLEVVVWATITSNKIMEAVISAMWGNNYEQKLINEYNSAVLGLIDGTEAESKISAYKNFLATRAKVKSEIEVVCQRYNIEQ